MSSPTRPIALNVLPKPTANKPREELHTDPALALQQWGVRHALFLLLSVVAFVIDCASKHSIFAWRGWPHAEQEVWWLIPNYLGIQTSVNHGAVFGLGAGYTAGFAILSFVALTVIAYFAFWKSSSLDTCMFYTLALVSAGILGNLYDRLGLFHTAGTPDWAKFAVRDWILFQCPPVPLRILNPWPNFNFADCYLVVGAGIMAWYSFYSPNGDTAADDSANATTN